MAKAAAVAAHCCKSGCDREGTGEREINTTAAASFDDGDAAGLRKGDSVIIATVTREMKGRGNGVFVDACSYLGRCGRDEPVIDMSKTKLTTVKLRVHSTG